MPTKTRTAAPSALPDSQGTPALEEHAMANGSRAGGHKNGHWRVVLIPVEKIDPCPWQPRTLFEPEEMEELAQSVKAHGVQQPVLVRAGKPEPQEKGAKKAPQRYELIAGERRLRASRMAGKKSIPAIVHDDLSDLQVAEIALLENVQRSNLSAIEEATGYRRLMLDFRLSEERLSKKVGKSVNVLREMMKLLSLPEEVQNLIRQKQLTPAHGHELLRLAASPQACQSVAAHAVNNKLPASALAKDPLPNWKELEKRGLVVPLDWRAKFDKNGCKACPHKAYVGAGLGGYGAFCLKPDEWKRKQDEAIQRESDEHARVLEEARRRVEARDRAEDGQVPEGEGKPHAEGGAPLPTLHQLPHGSYKDLRFGDLPEGCTGSCPCRGYALDPHACDGEHEDAARIPVCMNPERYREMQRSERLRRDEERREHFMRRFEGALETLLSDWEQGERRRAAALAFTPFLDGKCARGVYLQASQWREMLERAAQKVGAQLPFEQLFDPAASDGDILRLLAGQSDEREGFEQGRLVLAGAGLLLLLEAESAARFGGETPLLDFVSPPEDRAQGALDLEDADEEREWDEKEDPFMEEDFPGAFPDEEKPSDPESDPDALDDHGLAVAALYGDEPSELPA